MYPSIARNYAQPVKMISSGQYKLLCELVTERGPAGKAAVDSDLQRFGLASPRDFTMDQARAAIKTVMAMPKIAPAITVPTSDEYRSWLEANEWFDGEYSDERLVEMFHDHLIQQREIAQDRAAARAKMERDERAARSLQRTAQRDFTKIPESHYALETADGHLEFFSVTVGKAGTKWAGYRFVEKLIGAPGSWRRIQYRGAQAAAILAKLLEDSYLDPGSAVPVEGPKAAALRYSRFHTVCAKCNSPLSDDKNRGKDGLTSLERGLGPVCATKY